MLQGKYQMNLEYLILPESKELLKELWRQVKKTMEWAWRGSHWSYQEQYKQQNDK